MDLPPEPHLCIDSTSSGDLVDKTPVGIGLKHVLHQG